MNEMDKECINLCQALNMIEGITTVESCCGHAERKYHIWFHAENFECLPHLLYWFMSCHCGFYEWRVMVMTDCGKSPVTFMIEGPKGDEAYEQSEKIAKLILEDQAEISREEL